MGGALSSLKSPEEEEDGDDGLGGHCSLPFNASALMVKEGQENGRLSPSGPQFIGARGGEESYLGPLRTVQSMVRGRTPSRAAVSNNAVNTPSTTN